MLRRGDSIFYNDAGDAVGLVFLGRLRAKGWMEGKRDSGYDHRSGIWWAARPWLVPEGAQR